MSPKPTPDDRRSAAGLHVEATRARGFDLPGLLEALEAAVLEVRAEMAPDA